MSRVTETEDKFLNELVKDCITFRLTETEVLAYIKARFHEISLRSYKQRKANVLSDQSTKVWLHHFTRIGFVQHHIGQIEVIKKIQDDSLRRLLEEVRKPADKRDDDLIIELKHDIRENAKVLSEFGLGTPIISAIKAKLDESHEINLDMAQFKRTLTQGANK